MSKELINFELTEQQLEKELKRVEQLRRRNAALKRLIFTLLVLAAASVLAAALWFPVLQITGDSMLPTFESGEAVLALRADEFTSGDVIAFYQDNRILARRVIAGAGDWVDIDASGQVAVNGELLQERYLDVQVLSPNDLTYPYQVPEGSLFVMGDNRAATIDSRMLAFGCVNTERIIGKVIFRIWPIRRLEYLG